MGPAHVSCRAGPGRAAARERGVFAMPHTKDAAMTFVDYRDVAATAFATDELVSRTFELAAGGMAPGPNSRKS